MNSDSASTPKLKAAGLGKLPSDRSIPRPTESSDDGPAEAAHEASDRRLYLAAMLHFFSDFTRRPGTDQGS
jgi:hypothetical protein